MSIVTAGFTHPHHELDEKRRLMSAARKEWMSRRVEVVFEEGWRHAVASGRAEL